MDQLSPLFSDYRGEWSAAVFGNLFIAPPYFAKLEGVRPCFLIGGRGTGKTTALRSLRFDSTAARLRADSLPYDSIQYYGIYVRVNKNRVRPFQGSDLSPDQWSKCFGHYFNLLCGIELCQLALWLNASQGERAIDFARVSRAYHLDEASTCQKLLSAMSSAVTDLEFFVNNPKRLHPPILSMAEAPVRTFVEVLAEASCLGGRPVFCCIDEYENLLDTQQGIINGYIKHAQPPLSYKVGVKRGGLRCRATVDSSDVISTPDDYYEIDIATEGFDLFAAEVVEHRLQRAKTLGIEVAETLDDFLPELPFGVEADLLGCGPVAERVMEEILAHGDQPLVKWARAIPKNQLYFVQYWSEAGNGSVADLASSWRDDPEPWNTRLGNYGYASLFWLSRGRKGARIRKYYAGSRTLLALASGNIRYFIELIDESLNLVLGDPTLRKRWNGALPPAQQTRAARAVGKRRLDQIDKLSEHGSEIKRLALAIGKVFFEYARDPIGKSPELNSFVVAGSDEARDRLLPILSEGVSNLTFEATPRTKATSTREIRDDEFRLHPIFAPFFEYSHRRKRRCTFRAETLLDVLQNPARALGEMLGGVQVRDEDLPQQLAMFTMFFESEGA